MLNVTLLGIEVYLLTNSTASTVINDEQVKELLEGKEIDPEILTYVEPDYVKATVQFIVHVGPNQTLYVQKTTIDQDKIQQLKKLVSRFGFTIKTPTDLEQVKNQKMTLADIAFLFD